MQMRSPRTGLGRRANGMMMDGAMMPTGLIGLIGRPLRSHGLGKIPRRPTMLSLLNMLEKMVKHLLEKFLKKNDGLKKPLHSPMRRTEP